VSELVERTMKPMLSACIQEAVHLALIDSVAVPFKNDEERAEYGCHTLASLSAEREEKPENFPQDESLNWDDPEVMGRLLAKDRPPTEEERKAWEFDIYAIPDEALTRMDLGALARNVACRLLGTGGWELPTPHGPMYAGNATTTEVFEASFERPDRDHVAEIAFDMGLKQRKDGMFEMPDAPPEEEDEA